MSFSADVKKELSTLHNLSDKEIVKAEWIGYLLTKNTEILCNQIKYATESEYNINRFGKLLENLGKIEYSICVQGKTYIISFPDKITQNELVQFIYENLNSETVQKALVRGAFLGSGSMNEPNKKYHLELMLRDEKSALKIENILKEHNIILKELQKVQGITLYTKEGEEISKFLAFIGANKSVLQFEDIRVLRDMRNRVNRVVNCETANLNKTISAAVKQIEDILFLKEINKFDNLNEGLKEVSELRIKHPEASLIELGKMLEKPIGKSGVNHRLKTIERIADEIRDS